MYIRRRINSIGKVADADADHDQYSRLVDAGRTMIPLRESALLVIDKRIKNTPSRMAVMRDFVRVAEAA